LKNSDSLSLFGLDLRDDRECRVDIVIVLRVHFSRNLAS